MQMSSIRPAVKILFLLALLSVVIGVSVPVNAQSSPQFNPNPTTLPEAHRTIRRLIAYVDATRTREREIANAEQLVQIEQYEVRIRSLHSRILAARTELGASNELSLQLTNELDQAHEEYERLLSDIAQKDRDIAREREFLRQRFYDLYEQSSPAQRELIDEFSNGYSAETYGRLDELNDAMDAAAFDAIGVFRIETLFRRFLDRCSQLSIARLLVSAGDLPAAEATNQEAIVERLGAEILRTDPNVFDGQNLRLLVAIRTGSHLEFENILARASMLATLPHQRLELAQMIINPIYFNGALNLHPDAIKFDETLFESNSAAAWQVLEEGIGQPLTQTEDRLNLIRFRMELARITKENGYSDLAAQISAGSSNFMASGSLEGLAMSDAEWEAHQLRLDELIREEEARLTQAIGILLENERAIDLARDEFGYSFELAKLDFHNHLFIAQFAKSSQPILARAHLANALEVDSVQDANHLMEDRQVGWYADTISRIVMELGAVENDLLLVERAYALMITAANSEGVMVNIRSAISLLEFRWLIANALLAQERDADAHDWIRSILNDYFAAIRQYPDVPELRARYIASLDRVNSNGSLRRAIGEELLLSDLIEQREFLLSNEQSFGLQPSRRSGLRDNLFENLTDYCRVLNPVSVAMITVGGSDVVPSVSPPDSVNTATQNTPETSLAPCERAVELGILLFGETPSKARDAQTLFRAQINLAYANRRLRRFVDANEHYLSAIAVSSAAQNGEGWRNSDQRSLELARDFVSERHSQ